MLKRRASSDFGRWSLAKTALICGRKSFPPCSLKAEARFSQWTTCLVGASSLSPPGLGAGSAYCQ